MNSLTELNGYVNSLSFEYTDNRYARVIFDRPTAENQTIIVNEGETFNFSSGIEVLEVINYATADLKLIIDISTVYSQGVRVQFSSTPNGVTISNNGSGIYTISGIVSQGIWDQVKLVNIVLPTNVPDAFYGTFVYDVDLTYYDANLGNQNRSYSVTVSVLDVTFMTTPLEFVYVADGTSLITNTPQIASYLDEDYPNAIWTITGTVSSSNSLVSFSSSYTGGGTFNYNSSTKSFTISGTRAQVNNHLNFLSITSNTVYLDFILYYALSNNQDTTTDTKTQLLKNSSIEFLTNPPDYYYTEDTQTTLDQYPQITDTSYTGTGIYTLTVLSSFAGSIRTLSSTGTGGSSSFNNSTKVLTITGTKSQVNSHLQNITMRPETDVGYLFQFVYSLTTPIGSTATKFQQIIPGSADTEIANMSLSRSYTANRVNFIFSSNTPFINDLDTNPSNVYTISLQCGFGVWSIDGTTYNSVYTFTGSRTACNEKFAQLRFYPNRNVSSNGIFNYTQLKNGIEQVNSSVSLLGTAGTFGNPRTIAFTSSQTWSPTLEDFFYGTYAAIVVGAGGGGGNPAGGGAGQSIYQHGLTFNQTSYTVTVGVGGSPLAGGNGTGGDGGASQFASIIANGGGGGGAYQTTPTQSGYIIGANGGTSGSGQPGGRSYYNPNSSTLFAGGGGGGNSSPGGDAFDTGGGSILGGNGGNGSWTYTNRLGQVITTFDYAGSGGGGSPNTSTPANDWFADRPNATYGGFGGNDLGGHGFRQSLGDNPVQDGGRGNTTPVKYAGEGGGGRTGRGGDGLIVLEIY